MEQGTLALVGEHNIYSSLTVGIATNIAGTRNEVIRKNLGDLPDAEHRLERVYKVGDIQYINDSKATNVDTCWYVSESM